MTDKYHKTAFACNGMMTWKSEYFQLIGWSHYRLTGTDAANSQIDLFLAESKLCKFGVELEPLNHFKTKMFATNRT